MPCRRCWFASERSGRGLGSRCGVARKRRAITLHQDCPPWHSTTVRLKEEVMFVIGIDPHKRSHTAAVLDDSEELVGQVRVNADRWQRDRLLRFAAPFEPRTWAVEAAGGLGALLAQQLVAAGERVVDVPPTCRRECGCSTRERRTSPTRTTRVPRPSSRCDTPSCGRFARSTIRRCCAYWRTVTTTSPRRGPGRSVGSTPCSAC